MNYRHIIISARLAPLSVVLTQEHQDAVAKEAALAEAGPELLAALKSLRAATHSETPGALAHAANDADRLIAAFLTIPAQPHQTPHTGERHGNRNRK